MRGGGTTICAGTSERAAVPADDDAWWNSRWSQTVVFTDGQAILRDDRPWPTSSTRRTTSGSRKTPGGTAPWAEASRSRSITMRADCFEGEAAAMSKRMRRIVLAVVAVLLVVGVLSVVFLISSTTGGGQSAPQIVPAASPFPTASG